VLYLTDIYGIQRLENRLLADSFGRAGYFVVAPDLFNGTPSTLDLNEMSPTQLSRFLAANAVEDTDALVAKGIDYIRNVKNISRIGTTGYCFGGRFAFRTLAAGTGVSVGFAAHPSNLQDVEIQAITGAVGVAAAGTLNDPQLDTHSIDVICSNYRFRRRYDDAAGTACSD
jgi:dienelactone hydrolase